MKESQPMPSPMIKITAMLGALMLLMAAGFHVTEMDAATAYLSHTDDPIARSLLAAWIMPIISWVFIACISVGLSRYCSKACAAVLLAFALWVLTDALVIMWQAGMSLSVYLLGAAGVSLLLSAVSLRAAARRG